MASGAGSLMSGFASGFMGGRTLQREKDRDERIGAALDRMGSTESSDKGGGAIPSTPDIKSGVTADAVQATMLGEDYKADGGEIKDSYSHDMMYGSLAHKEKKSQEEYSDMYGDSVMAESMPMYGSEKLFDPCCDAQAHTGMTNDFKKK